MLQWCDKILRDWDWVYVVWKIWVNGCISFIALLGPFLIIFWMFSKRSLHELNKVKYLFGTNWLIEQLIIMIWKKFCQMELLVFVWKVEKIWSLWRNKRRVFRKKLLRRPNAFSAIFFLKMIWNDLGTNAPSWKIFFFFFSLFSSFSFFLFLFFFLTFFFF